MSINFFENNYLKSGFIKKKLVVDKYDGPLKDPDRDFIFILNKFKFKIYKFYLDTINGLNNKDVRISKRKSLSTKRLRGFEKGKIGPVDGSDHIGGNYAAALNFEANLPNFLPDNSNADIGFFLDFANVWGVDYDSSLGDSSKIRSSIGIGVDWYTPIGPLSFSLAQPLSKKSSDKTESFRFNLGTTF